MIKPPHPKAERSSVHNAALEQAALALQRGMGAEAERLATGVLKADRGNVAAVRILGGALLLQDRPQEAIKPLQRAAKRDGGPAIETLLGKVLMAVGQTVGALDQLRLAASRRPPYPQGFLELGVALGEAGLLEEGIAVFETGLSLMPDADGFYVGLGHLHLKRNDRAKAKAAFQFVHSRAHGRSDAMAGLAKVLTLEGDYEPAAELYRRAVAARPDDGTLRIGLGACLLELNQREAGEAAMRTAGAVGMATSALTAASHGRAFLRPSLAAKFLGAKP